MFSKRERIQSIILERRRFVNLMDLYDRNFALLNRVIPELQSMPGVSKTIMENYPDLYLKIQKRCKFTTMMNLTYRFSVNADNSIDEPEYVEDPDLNIRVYHDARMVEAVSCKTKGLMPIGLDCFGEQNHFACRWDSNIFLNKWLEYIIGIGYVFTESTIVEEEIKGKALDSV